MRMRHMWRTTPAAMTVSLMGCVAGCLGAVFFFLRNELFSQISFVHAHGLFWLFVSVTGFAMELGGFWWHDRWHLHRGEVPEAMWGEDDKRRPRWLGGPRHPGSPA